MIEFFRCDSCKKIYPKSVMKEVKYSYSAICGKAKESLQTETVYGMLCINCGQEAPVNTQIPTSQDTPKPEPKKTTRYTKR